jgi:hypothetical protein
MIQIPNDPRRTPLLDSQRVALADWIKKRKYRHLSGLLGCHEGSIRRWKRGGPVTDAIYTDLCEALDARRWEIEGSDPADDFRRAVTQVNPEEQRQVVWATKPKARAHGLQYADVDPQTIVTVELALADNGRPKDAFRALLGHFSIRAVDDLACSLSLLPALIYMGYRYMVPHDLISAIRDVALPAIQRCGQGLKCEPWIKPLCISQIACALNERGGSDTAGLTRQLFADEVSKLTVPACPCPWPKQQLLHNEAYYWAQYGGSTQKALDLVKEADTWGQSIHDQRAAGTLKHAAYMQRGQLDKAWESIEPAYYQLRPILLTAASCKQGQAPDFLSLFSAMFTGSAARSIANVTYPRSERVEDVRAMNWCLETHGPIQLGKRSLVPAGIRVHEDLSPFQVRCERLCFDTHQTDVLEKVIRALNNIF